jgi:hypothetical protein
LHQNGGGDLVHEEWNYWVSSSTNVMLKRLKTLKQNNEHPANLIIVFEFYSQLPQFLKDSVDEDLLAKYNQLVGILERSIYEYFGYLDEWGEQGDMNQSAKYAFNIYYDWVNPDINDEVSDEKTKQITFSQTDLRAIDPECDIEDMELALQQKGSDTFVNETLLSPNTLVRLGLMLNQNILTLNLVREEEYFGLTKLLISEMRRPFEYSYKLDGMYSRNAEYNRDAAELRYLSILNRLK